MTNFRKIEMPPSKFNDVEKNLKNVNETQAGRKALELDKADGKQDGKISASIWNEYARAHGGKEIKNEINVIDATNSITTYSVREQTEAEIPETGPVR